MAGTKRLLLVTLGLNDNDRTLFHPAPNTQPTWGTTKDNAIVPHMKEGAVVMFFKPGPKAANAVRAPERPYQRLPPSTPNANGAVVAIGVIDKVTVDMSGASGDALWSHRLKYNFGQRGQNKDGKFTHIFTVKDIAMTPWWGKRPMLSFLGFKDTNNLIGAFPKELSPLHPVWQLLDRVWMENISNDSNEDDDDCYPLVFKRQRMV